MKKNNLEEKTIESFILELQATIEDIRVRNNFSEKEMNRIIDDVITIAEIEGEIKDFIKDKLKNN